MKKLLSFDFDRINLTFLFDSNTGSGRLKTAHQNSVYDRFRGTSSPSFSLSGDLVRDLSKHQGHQIDQTDTSDQNEIRKRRQTQIPPLFIKDKRV